ncbi:DUF11 domain-containing protein [Streptomyces sp. MAR4 CNY-716]
MRTAIASAAMVAGLLASLAPSPPLAPGTPPPDGTVAPSSPVRLALERRDAADGGTAYAITVHNTSGADAPHGRVTQLLPDSLEYVSASPRATATGQQVTWEIMLPAGTSRELAVTAAPGPAGDRVRRAQNPDRGPDPDAAGAPAPRRTGAAAGAPASATTVCFQGGDRGEWLTCTSADDEWSPEPWVSSNKIYAAVSAAAALLVGTAGIVILRRRRSRDTEDDQTR